MRLLEHRLVKMQNSPFLFCSVPPAALGGFKDSSSQLAQAGAPSLRACAGLRASCPFSLLVGWKLHGSEWQLGLWRRWAGVQLVGRRLAPLGRSCTRRPNALAEEKHERESCTGRGETEGTLQREGAVAFGLGSLRARACGGEVPKAFFPAHRCLSAFSIIRRRRGICGNDVSELQEQSCSMQTWCTQSVG